jgi:hypothetical protein
MLWNFLAYLDNGQTLEGTEIFADIFRLKDVKVKSLHCAYDEQVRLSIEYTHSQRIIFFREVEGVLNAGGTIVPIAHTYFVGWQSTVNGVNVKCINQLCPNGRIILRNTDGRA